MASSGTVKGTFDERGFVFIEPDQSAGIEEDVFLHITALREGEDSSLFVRGARVEFDVIMVRRGGESKPQGRDAVLTGGGAVAGGPIVLEDAQAGGGQPGQEARSGGPSVITKTDLRGHIKFWYPTGYGFLS